jgi:hypothetical protein
VREPWLDFGQDEWVTTGPAVLPVVLGTLTVCLGVLTIVVLLASL